MNPAPNACTDCGRKTAHTDDWTLYPWPDGAWLCSTCNDDRHGREDYTDVEARTLRERLEQYADSAETGTNTQELVDLLREAAAALKGETPMPTQQTRTARFFIVRNTGISLSVIRYAGNGTEKEWPDGYEAQVIEALKGSDPDDTLHTLIVWNDGDVPTLEDFSGGYMDRLRTLAAGGDAQEED